MVAIYISAISVARRHLRFLIKSLTFLTITFLRTFCHLSAICVGKTHVEQKFELTSVIIFYNFRSGLSRQECIDELNFVHSEKAPSYDTVKNLCNEFNRG